MALSQVTLPAADAQACTAWSEQDNNLYNTLPFYFVKMMIEYRKTSYIWSRFCGKIRWKPNMGPTMRAITKVPSPRIRQMFFPNPIDQAARKDIIDVREQTRDEVVYHQKFESEVFNFLPNFRDFLTDHVDFCLKDITEKITQAEDIFIRGRILHRSPYMWIPGASVADANGEYELKTAPVGVGNRDGTDGKTTNYLQQLASQVGPAGYLSFESLNKALTVHENDIGAPPFKGDSLPKDSQGLSGMFALALSSEAFNQFTFDPWLLAHKNCNLDVVNDRFRGSIFGRITTIVDGKPLRMKADGTFTAPEVREVGPNAYNKGESVPNPTYTKLDDATGSPYELPYLIGAEGYDVIETGPPPAPFAASGMPEGFGKMEWNGKVIMTKNLMVPCAQDDGTIVYDTNKYGEYLQLVSKATYGSLAKQPRNVLPMLIKRKRGQ